MSAPDTTPTGPSPTGPSPTGPADVPGPPGLAVQALSVRPATTEPAPGQPTAWDLGVSRPALLPEPVPGEPQGLTPSQTVGPYLSIGLTWDDGHLVVPEGTPGAVWLRFRVLDGAGADVPDALVETWQADTAGRFAHPDDPRGAVASDVPGFVGFGRAQKGPDGRYAVLTVKPGPVPDGDGGWQAPHIDVSVFARGLLERVVTRICFADEPAANASDPVLAVVAPERRETLLATPTADGYALDVVLQGPRETVFFAV